VFVIASVHPVDPKGVPEIATPAHYVLENIMKITQFSVVAHRNQAGDHRAYVAQYSSQNQSFERDRSRHPSSLRYSPTPDFLTLSATWTIRLAGAKSYCSVFYAML
jgi:hypothetical protein